MSHHFQAPLLNRNIVTKEAEIPATEYQMPLVINMANNEISQLSIFYSFGHLEKSHSKENSFFCGVAMNTEVVNIDLNGNIHVLIL